jgi:hypothetical protein
LEPIPIMVLPLPSTEIPPSRPYTAVTMASARTSTTQVDLDVPPFPGGTQRDESPAYSRNGSGIVHREAGIETEVAPQMPQTSLTFLLVSGRRRTMSFDPDTTVGRVKELVWNAWPSEWQDERPPAPSYFRILYLGKMLQDDDTLTKLSFPSCTQSPSAPTPASTSASASTSNTPTATIVHLSIRPYAPPADVDALKKKNRRRRTMSADTDGSREESTERGCCSGCVIC